MARPFPNPTPLITAEALAAELGHPDLRLFDCTTHLLALPDNSGLRVESGRGGYDQGHIPGAAFLDLARDLSDTASPFRFALPNPASFAAAAGRLGIGNGSRVVLYDSTYGAWGARVWWMLKGHGFEHARVLDGGLTTWKLDGRPLETTARSYAPATFTARAPRSGHFVGKEEVKAAIGTGGTGIVNALLPEQHRGSSGVHYGRPGRIPGSCNVPSRVRSATEASSSVIARVPASEQPR